jgi:hypothetical protein
MSIKRKCDDCNEPYNVKFEDTLDDDTMVYLCEYHEDMNVCYNCEDVPIHWNDDCNAVRGN